MPGAKARLRLDGADPINRGLVGFWPLTDGAGLTARDISPWRQGVRLSSVVQASNSGWGVGPQGRQLNFDGTDDYVSVPNNVRFDPPTTNEFTMAIWASTTAAFGWRGVFTKNRESPGNIIFGIWLNSTGNWHFNVNNNAVNSPTTATTNTPTFLCMTYKAGATTTAYLNGASIGTTSTTMLTGGFDLMIGRAGGVSEFFAGALWGARFWNRALTAGEVTRLYREPWAGTARTKKPALYRPPVSYPFTPDPVGYEYSPADVDLTYTPGTVQLDTHDGLRRSRRLRRIEALRQRGEAERLADAQALRLSLEAALGLAAEVVPEVAPRVAEAVQRAPKPADVDWRRVAEDAEQYARLSRAVAKLSALVQAEARRMADDDDDDAAFLLGVV